MVMVCRLPASADGRRVKWVVHVVPRGVNYVMSTDRMGCE